MTEAGEAFYLLYYVNDDSEDYFIERSPEGALRRIEKPENLLHLGSSAHVIVKLNGGLAYRTEIEERVSIERAHFERLAARIPAILPGYLRAELRARSSSSLAMAFPSQTSMPSSSTPTLAVTATRSILGRAAPAS